MKYTAEKVHARFEAWAEENGYDVLRNDGFTAAAWHGYQAAYAERIKADEMAADYPECSGDPSSCPENEGFGCCQAHAEAITLHPPAQAAAQGGVTDGWVLVPVEPTEAMQTAHHIYGDTSDWWSAVIAAVPSAPEGESHE